MHILEFRQLKDVNKFICKDLELVRHDKNNKNKNGKDNNKRRLKINSRTLRETKTIEKGKRRQQDDKTMHPNLGRT